MLVVYTWSTVTAGAEPTDDDMEAVVSVSSTAQPLPLDGTTAAPDRVNDYAEGENVKIKATVQYYEVDPETGAISVSKEYSAVTKTINQQDAVPETTSVSFDLTTSIGGLTAAITTTGAASSEAGSPATARLQVSTDGESGWITVDTADADTEDGSANAELDVDADGDGSDTEGDGGGLYYRVVYAYTDDDDDSQTATSEVIQLGTVTDPDDNATVTNILSAATPSAGETIRIDNQGNDVEVQWQMLSSRPGSQWTDIEGATGVELDVADAHAGNMLRAKVTYTADDDATTTDVDEEGWPVWVEYTQILTVSGATGNTNPAATQANHVLRVDPDQKSSAKGAVQKATVATFDASSLFFDADGDDLTYTITAAPTDLDNEDDINAALEPGGSVFLSETTMTDTTDFQQSFSIDQDTGMVTYVTDREDDHDGTDTDGTGNTLTFTVSASDGAAEGTAATATVMVRVNVAPTAINLTDQADNEADLPAPGLNVTGTALMDGTGAVSYTDDAENEGTEVATINVMDQNLGTDMFGTHKVTLSGRGADQFEVVETDDDETDGSTWEIRLKDDAVFDFEKLATAKEKAAKAASIELSITVTATDGGGSSTKGVFKVTVVDAKTDDDPEAPTTTPKTDDPDPEVPGLEDDADDSDNDGPVIPPDDGGAFIGDDLLDDFVLAIDDIDVA